MKVLLALIGAASLTFAAPPAREYRLDSGHTEIAFSIGFLGHPVRGRFDTKQGTISYVADNPAASSVTVVISANSITTGSAHRDEHLRSPDFFDAARYPYIVFRSSSVARRRDSLIVTGSLFMHGVTQTVVIPFLAVPPVADPHGSSLVYFGGRVRLARKNFGILGGGKYNDWFDDLRSATMADSVDIALDLAGWDPDVDRTPQYATQVKRVEQGGIDSTLAKIRAMPRDNLAGSEFTFEQIARGVQAHGRTDHALALMRLSADVFAKSSVAQAGLARIFELSGAQGVDSARIHARRALALDPMDTRAMELGRRLGIERAP